MNRQEISKILEKFIFGLSLLTVAIFPLFFLPLFSDFYDLPKNALLIFASLALLVAWAGEMAAEGKVSFRLTRFDLPIALIPLTYIISTLVASVNKLETFWLPTGTGTVIALTILYFVISNNLAGKGKYLANALILSAVILSLLSFLQFAGLSQNLSPAAWLKDKAWSPIGNQVSLAVFLAVAAVLAGIEIYQAGKEGKINLSFGFWGVILVVLGAGLALSFYQLTTSAKPLFLPYAVSWAVTIGTFKDFKALLFGLGTNGFLEAFARYRPIEYNLSPLWGVRFLSASSFLLQVATTIGLLGLAAWFLLLWQIRGFEKLVKEKYTLLPLGLVLLSLIFLPGTIITLSLFFFLLAAAANIKEEAYAIEESSKILPVIILSLAGVIALVGVAFTGRVLAADYFFQQSLQAFTRGEGTTVYNQQIRAIDINPYNSTYRLAYSQTNLALASSLAGRADLSDEDRATISQLVQQSIREGKAAVALKPRSIIAWENLANIYRQLINFATGADQWALASLQQAIVLDPLNPGLRISLGGLLYSQSNFDDAIRFFQQAVDLKPDLANAHYNLAAAYREKKEYARAAAEMEITLGLVEAGTPDFDKAKKELDDLKSKLPAATPSSQLRATEAGELIAPSPLPSPVVKPPLELPEGAAPPATESSPTPTTTP